MKRKSFLWIAGIAALIFGLASCSNLVDIDSEKNNEAKNAILVLNVGNSSARTIFANDIPFADMTYTLKGTKLGGTEETLIDNSAYAVLSSPVNVQTGKWNFELIAKKSGKPVYSAVIENKQISEGQNTLDFVLQEIAESSDGTGTAKVTISVPEDANVVSIEVSLIETKTLRTKSSDELTLSKNQAIYNKKIPVGTYLLQFVFYAEDYNRIDTYSEVIQIKKDRVSEKTIEITDFEKIHTITYNGEKDVYNFRWCVPTFFIEQENVDLPTKDDVYYTDHIFLGWYNNEKCEGEPISVILAGTKHDVELWAKWDPIGVGATFDENTASFGSTGGTVEISIPEHEFVDGKAYKIVINYELTSLSSERSMNWSICNESNNLNNWKCEFSNSPKTIFTIDSYTSSDKPEKISINATNVVYKNIFIEISELTEADEVVKNTDGIHTVNFGCIGGSTEIDFPESPVTVSVGKYYKASVEYTKTETSDAAYLYLYMDYEDFERYEEDGYYAVYFKSEEDISITPKLRLYGNDVNVTITKLAVEEIFSEALELLDYNIEGSFTGWQPCPKAFIVKSGYDTNVKTIEYGPFISTASIISYKYKSSYVYPSDNVYAPEGEFKFIDPVDGTTSDSYDFLPKPEVDGDNILIKGLGVGSEFKIIITINDESKKVSGKVEVIYSAPRISFIQRFKNHAIMGSFTGWSACPTEAIQWNKNIVTCGPFTVAGTPEWGFAAEKWEDKFTGVVFSMDSSEVGAESSEIELINEHEKNNVINGLPRGTKYNIIIRLDEDDEKVYAKIVVVEKAPDDLPAYHQIIINEGFTIRGDMNGWSICSPSKISWDENIGTFGPFVSTSNETMGWAFADGEWTAKFTGVDFSMNSSTVGAVSSELQLISGHSNDNHIIGLPVGTYFNIIIRVDDDTEKVYAKIVVVAAPGE